MVEPEKPGFDTAAFLASAGLGRRIIQLAPKEAFFSQGDPADSVFYLQTGRAKTHGRFHSREGSYHHASLRR